YGSGDGVRQHFTGYEADNETGLNFAQARYQSSIQGRFTSVDPLGASADSLNPQTFNRYSYVNNDPVNQIDRSGLMAYTGADQSWADLSDGFWGSHIAFGMPRPERTRIMQTLQQSNAVTARWQWIQYTDGEGNEHTRGWWEKAWHDPRIDCPWDGISMGALAQARPGFGIPYPQRFVNLIKRMLPRKVGRTLGAQSLFASGDQVTGGTVTGFVLHDLVSNSDTFGATYGGGTHSAEKGYWGQMLSLGVGDGYLISNARDDEVNGDSQAVMISAGLFGAEVDLSHGKDG